VPATEEEINEVIKNNGEDAARIFLHHEIDVQTQEKVVTLKNLVDKILSDPEIYGYAGGFGITRKTYQLSTRVDVIESAYRRGDSQEGEKLIAELESELKNAYERAAKAIENREKRVATKAIKNEQEEKAAEERERNRIALREYQRKLAEVDGKYKRYPGWGIYTFPIGPDGLPQNYRQDGRVYSFDTDFFEVLPEKEVPCWGYVTQWSDPTKVALILEVVK